jgi:uracil-DNA glycosylase
MKRETKLIEKLGKGWYNKLESFLWSENFTNIKKQLAKEKRRILPESKNLFKSFKLTPWEELKVVIIGKTPYDILSKNKPVADGLAYSYNNTNPVEIATLPEIINIIQEMDNDMNDGAGFPERNTQLSDLAEQGVLLLNSSLTCVEGYRNAHRDLWILFVKEVINKINEYNSGIIFMLWGKHGEQFENLIDTKLHYVLKAGDPEKGGDAWFGCNNFSKANEILKKNNGAGAQIVWYDTIF